MFDVKKNIIFEDKHIIVVVKPAGILSQSGKSNDKSMVEYLSEYLIFSGQRKKTPFIGVIHRLDRNVGGVMVFGKTKEGTAEVNKQIQNGLFKKKYLALVLGIPNNKEGILENYMTKNSKTNTSYVSNKENKNAKLAKLKYKVINEIEFENSPLSLLDIELFTGRHHQIRVQLSSIGNPIVGDFKYMVQSEKYTSFSNKKQKLNLWSYYIKFKLPFSKNYMEFTKYPEEYNEEYLISKIMNKKEEF